MRQQVRDFLKSLFGDDEASIEMTYQQFCEDMYGLMQDYEQATYEEDFEKIKRVAHTMKGNAGIIGDTELANAAKEFYDAAQFGDMKKIDEAYQHVVKVYENSSNNS